MSRKLNLSILIMSPFVLMLGLSCSQQKQAEKEAEIFFKGYTKMSPYELIQDAYKTEITRDDLKEIFTDSIAEIMYYILNNYTEEDKVNQIKTISEKYIVIRNIGNESNPIDSVVYTSEVPFSERKEQNSPTEDGQESFGWVVSSHFLKSDCAYDDCSFLMPSIISVSGHWKNEKNFNFIRVNNKFILMDRLFHFAQSNLYVIKSIDKDISTADNYKKEYPNFKNYFLENIEEKRIEMVRKNVRFESSDKIDLSTFFEWNYTDTSNMCVNGYYAWGTSILKEYFAYRMWDGINQKPSYNNDGTINWSEIEAFIGIKVILTKDINSGLNQYNPEFINWMTQTLLPDPNSKGILLNKFVIKNQLYGEAYRYYFKSIVREYAMIYKELQTNNMIEGEKRSYMKEMQSKNFDGPKYFINKYPGCNAFIYGFWLRRSMDGTIDECWKGLKKVMTLYDKDYYNKELINL